MSTASDRPLRKDAQRNRDKLVAAATELFAAQGPDVSLEAVARAAGTGIGTLYRHFPTRDDLIEAVYRTEVAALGEAADALLAEHEPDVALERWMDRYLAYVATKRGLGEALRKIAASSAPDLLGGAKAGLMDALDRILAAGVERGTFRSDVDAADVLRAMNAVWMIEASAPGGEEQARTILKLVRDGLRYGAG